MECVGYLHSEDIDHDDFMFWVKTGTELGNIPDNIPERYKDEARVIIKSRLMNSGALNSISNLEYAIDNGMGDESVQKIGRDGWEGSDIERGKGTLAMLMGDEKKAEEAFSKIIGQGYDLLHERFADSALTERIGQKLIDLAERMVAEKNSQGAFRVAARLAERGEWNRALDLCEISSYRCECAQVVMRYHSSHSKNQ